MSWLVSRFKEPSTWRGIIWLLTAFGVTLKPEVWEQIAAAGMALAGLIGVLTRDELPPIELVGTSHPENTLDAAVRRVSQPDGDSSQRVSVLSSAEAITQRNDSVGWNG